MSIDSFSAHRQANTATLRPATTAVLVIDMLNDFCKPGGAMVLPGYEALLAPQMQVTGAARQGGAGAREQASSLYDIATHFGVVSNASTVASALRQGTRIENLIAA